MKNITFLSAQPLTLYYLWQLEVMLTNFEIVGIDSLHDIHVLLADNPTDAITQHAKPFLKKLSNRFKKVQFFVYQDSRKDPHYISSLRPHIIKKHFMALPDMQDRAIFYHDCDMIFTKEPDFLSGLLDVDTNWYVSDCISYIGHDYIKSKGDDILQHMCNIVGINPLWVQHKQSQSGGAQYLMKFVPWTFWHKVEMDSERLYKEVSALNYIRKKNDPEYHELQIWTADMWAVLWNAWMLGFNTNVIPEMDFVWPTDRKEELKKKYIFHNAGITPEMANAYFHKNSFTNQLPYSHDGSKYLQDKASYWYWQQVRALLSQSCLHINKMEEILSSYGKAFKPTDAEKEIARQRLAVCENCEHWKKGFIDSCGLCHCPTKIQVFSPKDAGACMAKKWPV